MAAGSHRLPDGSDPAARRNTQLAHKLAARIRADGPVSVAEYVATCLMDPDHGYYIHRPVLGAAGDFVTAPEISQVFGELTGIWTALVWQQMGMPRNLRLIELGPGRGTLMTDLLRAASKVPGMADAIELHLVEANHELRKQQLERLAPLVPGIRQHPDLGAAQAALAGGDTASIVIANEFLDALGIRQVVASHGRWHERCVSLDQDGRLQFVAGRPCDATPAHWPDAGQQPDETLFETNPSLDSAVTPFLAAIMRGAPLAALFIDYGHEHTRVGETLQAVRQHTYEDPLTSPGEADLTAHVDFAAVSRSFAGASLTCSPLITQAEFLGRLGIVERTSHLMSANPDRAAHVEAGTLRLMAPNGMGTRFKVLGAASPSLGPLPVLEAPPA